MSKLKKIKLYSLLCIPVRSIPIITLFLTNKFNSYISLLYLFMGIAFLFRATSYKSTQKGLFGGNVWWQKLRVIHGLFYLLIGLNLIKDEQKKFLLIFDLLLGIYFFIKKYSK